MKNYLIAIDNELQEYYNKFTSTVKSTGNLQLESSIQEFCENTIAILDYYVEPIFKNGKMVVDKKLGVPVKPILNNEEIEFVNKYKSKDLNNLKYTLQTAIISCFEYRTSDKNFYEEMIEIIIAKCIRLFKFAQLFEYKNQNITKVNLISDTNISCPICQTLSKFSHDVTKLMDNIEDLHPYCKLSIEPNNNLNNINFTINKTNIAFLNLPINLKDNITTLITQLKIYCSDLLTDKNFLIVDDIKDTSDFIDLLNLKYDDDKILELYNQIKDTLGLFEVDDKVFISRGHLNNLRYFVVQSLLETNLMKKDLEWWKIEYYNKQKTKYIGDDVGLYANPFISYIAEQNYESYFLESAIYYILNPQLLKDIDPENYNQLKHTIFENTEFLRG
jgi:hypothetical protein